jgi:hypothetical protein
MRVFWLSLRTKVNGLSMVWPQNHWDGFLQFGLTVTVSWFGPQNQADFGLSVVPQNRWREDGMGHVSRFGGLLHL